jgi:hypothetical protein
MHNGTLIGLATILLVFGGILSLPYLVHFDNQQMERPTVLFNCVGWKVVLSTLYTALLIGTLGYLVAVVAQGLGTAPWVYIVLIITSVLLLRLAFVQSWLHVTYWHHEWGVNLLIDRLAQTVTYIKSGNTKHFLLTDVRRITRYESYRRRSYFSRRSIRQPFHYQIWELSDGTELVITCLLYSFTEPSALVPAVSGHLVKPRICWLPGDPLITLHYASIFYL